jgi:transcriptional regulator with XRE-family HTH domain
MALSNRPSDGVHGINQKMSMHIGKIIKEVRLEKALTQTELAQKSGISNAYLSQIESEKQEPSLDTLEKISEVLDTPVYILFFKAINEENIQNPDNKRFTKEIKRAMKGLIDELYAVEA